MTWTIGTQSIGGTVCHAPERLTLFRRPFTWVCFVVVSAVIYVTYDIHYRFLRPCVIASVSEKKYGIQYAAEDFHTLCSQEDYPDSFRLETNGRDVLIGQACTENTYEIHAYYIDNEERHCQPWADIQGRILGPGLNEMPIKTQYYLKFQSVKINHVENGLFEVVVPNVEPGEYWLELLVTHDFSSLGTMYSPETYTNQKCLACVDYSVINTPIKMILVENDQCVKTDERTPLCVTGKESGRWVTLPETGCDGVVCDGNINILDSSRRVWAPYNCHYKLYTPHELKSCTENKNLLFIGDSLVVEIADAILQLELFNNSLPLSWELTKLGAVINREANMRQWRRPWDNDVWLGFDFIFGDPLGCGIGCVTQMSDDELKRRLAPHGNIDTLVLFTGVHDIAPIDRLTAKNYDVFERYQRLLPVFIEKISKLMKTGGRIMWLLAPWTSDHSRCDFLSKPRLTLSNKITRSEVKKHPHVTLIDYFQITESCFCGDIHKGTRFHLSAHADKQYNGFMARMVVHQLLTLLCAH